MKTIQHSYWKKISDTIRSVIDGLQLTFRHLKSSTKTRPVLSITSPEYFGKQTGIATIQYPHQILPVPDNGRYRLHNEIDDCIVCDKCAKVCPVDCIDIEPIRSVEEFGKTSDGTPKRIYAARFDIDMGKCCFCGLCTTVCPTECLTMTRVYDFSVTDMSEHNFAFAEMSAAEIAEKKQIFANHQKSKEVAKPNPDTASGEASKPGSAKQVFKPKMKPPGSPTD